MDTKGDDKSIEYIKKNLKINKKYQIVNSKLFKNIFTL